ncbi:MAG: thioredoxin domain-containing protein, partial [Gammaproteobacteria bacterium]
MSTTRNRLDKESSPYLRQHADNPVDWYPWGEEALQKARREDKPILLSVGYSACHWCHVMAHESFEDPETAHLMNQLFVNIKVDREERPDLDKIYQLAHQMLVQRPGGWPLTMFLTADDHSPFFGGTYFPDKPRHGMPAFADILQRVEKFYRESGDELRQQSQAIREVFQKIDDSSRGSANTALDEEPVVQARQQLEQNFDSRWGGFGSAPKFPHPTSIERLLRHWRRHAIGDNPDLQALFMSSLSLQRMAQGGICDQLGGGFYRYAVDGYWMIPHFEKMLYDNGPLLALYSQAWAATNEPLFERTANRTADWAVREMQSAEGGYYASLDADSEGGEGAFYVWSRDEASEVLDASEYDVLAAIYGLDRDANFEGNWHFFQQCTMEDAANNLSLSVEDVQRLADSGTDKLLAVRDSRIRPARDEKILTSWNGLMISGMAIAARHLRRTDLADSALLATEFLRDNLWIDGRLHASFKDDEARHLGFLDDYAFLIAGILDLLQVRWRTDLLTFACHLADALLEHYLD